MSVPYPGDADFDPRDAPLVTPAPGVDPTFAFEPTLRARTYEERLREMISSARGNAHQARRELTELVGPDAVARAAASGNAEDLGVPAGPPGSHGDRVFRAVDRGSSMHHTHALYARELRDLYAADARITEQTDDYARRRIQAMNTSGDEHLTNLTDAQIAQIRDEVTRLRAGRHDAYIRSRRHAPSGTYPWHAAWAREVGAFEGRRINHQLIPRRNPEAPRG
jgi:Spy/CpxP family protein refolding chaperone